MARIFDNQKYFVRFDKIVYVEKKNDGITNNPQINYYVEGIAGLFVLNFDDEETRDRIYDYFKSEITNL